MLLCFLCMNFSLAFSYPIRLMYAKDYMRHKKYRLALMYVDEYLLLFPNGKYVMEAYEIMASCYMKMFRYKKAGDIYVLLYSLSNNDKPKYLFKAGKLYAIAGFYKKAVEIFDTIIERYKGLEIAKRSLVEKEVVKAIRQGGKIFGGF